MLMQHSVGRRAPGGAYCLRQGRGERHPRRGLDQCLGHVGRCRRRGGRRRRGGVRTARAAGVAGSERKRYSQGQARRNVAQASRPRTAVFLSSRFFSIQHNRGRERRLGWVGRLQWQTRIQQRRCLVAAQRFGEEVTLHILALPRPHDFQLCLVLDALDHHLQSELPRHGVHRA